MTQAPWQEIGISYEMGMGSKRYSSTQEVYIQWEEEDNKQSTR